MIMDNFSNQYQPLMMPQSINPYQNMEYMMQKPKTELTIGKFMHDFNNKVREQFNNHWFERKDDDIIEGMKNIILSCQRDKYFVLEVVNFETIKDYDRVQKELYAYYSTKKKNGKKIDNPYDYIDLRDSDIMLLKVTYHIKLNIPANKIRKDPKTGLDEQTEGMVDVLIMLPRYVNKYYFHIQGNNYYPVFQIVDGSTYNNATSNNVKNQTIVLKTPFTPIKVYKEYYELVDIVDGSVNRCVLFTAYIFKKKTDACKFMLARYGFAGTMQLLELEGIYIRRITDGPMDTERFFNFTDPQGKIIVSVVRKLFSVDNVTQSLVYTLLRNIKKLDTREQFSNPRFWNRSLGSDFMSATLDKGIPVLDSFENIYDVGTRNSVRLPIEEKFDTYHILRWIMREFSYLRQKDNINISTKHPRMADEYIPAIYAMKISLGIYRISDKGRNVTYKDVLQVIDTPPNYIIKNINQPNLINFVDLVNDDDSKLALSYTYKGISGLGEGSGSSVPQIYRSVHPSHLGRVDLDSSSASDPGLSGIICPMAKIYDGSFSDFKEPNGWSKFYNDTLNSLKESCGMKQGLIFTRTPDLEYDYVKEDMVKETIESYKKYIPGLIDIRGKKDYTKGAIIVKEEDEDINKEIILEGDSDGIGEISTTLEEVPEFDD